MVILNKMNAIRTIFLIFACKITKKNANNKKYLHISQKSSNFAVDFATIAQLVEQLSRNE